MGKTDDQDKGEALDARKQKEREANSEIDECTCAEGLKNTIDSRGNLLTRLRLSAKTPKRLCVGNVGPSSMFLATFHRERA